MDEQPMAHLTLGGWGVNLCMTVEDAAAIMRLVSKARKLDTRFTDGAYRYHIGGDLPELVIKLLTPEQYAEGIINGEFKAAPPAASSSA